MGIIATSGPAGEMPRNRCIIDRRNGDGATLLVAAVYKFVHCTY